MGIQVWKCMGTEVWKVWKTCGNVYGAHPLSLLGLLGGLAADVLMGQMAEGVGVWTTATALLARETDAPSHA